jgi:hypothetical protein
MSAGRIRALLFALLLIIAAGCEVHNKNSVTCHDDDCNAACETLGFTGGACDENECACGDADGAPYEWDDAGDDAG